MANFSVEGPFKLPTENLGNGRFINISDIWNDHKDFKKWRKSRGVYVYAIKPPKTKTYTPYYIGKATQSFEQEVFTERNQLKYARALARYVKGFPVMFFVVHPKSAGKPNYLQIGQIEDYLIEMGYRVNPNIENDKGTKQPKWGIDGVIRGSGNKPKNSAKHLAKAFDLHKKDIEDD